MMKFQLWKEGGKTLLNLSPFFRLRSNTYPGCRDSETEVQRLGLSQRTNPGLKWGWVMLSLSLCFKNPRNLNLNVNESGGILQRISIPVIVRGLEFLFSDAMTCLIHSRRNYGQAINMVEAGQTASTVSDALNRRALIPRNAKENTLLPQVFSPLFIQHRL